MENIVKIARAIIVNDKKILLCHSHTGGHYFLPGGHVEAGETSVETLKREMIEETRVEVTEIKFLLDFPNTFLRDGVSIDEVATIFLAKMASTKIISTEDWIYFDWIPVKDLPTIDFKPKETAFLIMKSIKENQSFWA